MSTTKNDIFKALVEGLVFEIKFISELMEKTGLIIKEFRAVGGGSKSEYWLNLKSSLMNKTVKKMKIDEAGCLATMMLAGSGTGKFKLEEAIKKFVKIEKTFYPEQTISKKYYKFYEKYKKIYPSIKLLI